MATKALQNNGRNGTTDFAYKVSNGGGGSTSYPQVDVYNDVNAPDTTTLQLTRLPLSNAVQLIYYADGGSGTDLKVNEYVVSGQTVALNFTFSQSSGNVIVARYSYLQT